MRRSIAVVCGIVLVVGAAGCESCLELDEYQLVPHGFGGSTTGTTTTSTTGGSGGAAGSQPSCDEIDGSVIVSMPLEPTNDMGPCDAHAAPRGGVRILALDPASGDCLGDALIERGTGTSSTASVHITHHRDTEYLTDVITHVAGTFRGGPLTMPLSCSTSLVVEVELPPSAAEAIFVAQLRRQGLAFCTDWVSTAGAATADLLSVSSVETVADGGVAITGSLGGTTASFDDGASSTDVQGTAFFASYEEDGSLAKVIALDGGPFDEAKGMASFGGNWLVTGTLLFEQPGCHGCSGTSNVSPAFAACGGVGGGSAGGAGGAGGAAGAGGTGGGAVASGDSHNAFLWRWSGGAALCDPFDTYGSDLDGATEAQAGFDVAVRAATGGCTTYWTGMAGRTTWRFDRSDAATSLYDAGGTSVDGFVAKLDSASQVGCGPGSDHAWNLRLTPTPATAVVWGNRVAPNACASGAVVTSFVSGAPLGSLALHHCDQFAGCTAEQALIPLADATRQLVVMGLDGSGGLDWHGVFGPVNADSFAAGGAIMGEGQDNVVLDNRDYVELVFSTTGPLVTSSVSTAFCPELDDVTTAATFAVGLARDGNGGQAQCEWAVRLGP